MPPSLISSIFAKKWQFLQQRFGMSLSGLTIEAIIADI